MIKEKRLTITVPEDLFYHLKMTAAARRCSLKKLIMRMVIETLKNENCYIKNKPE